MKSRILYISSGGIREPLIVSQVCRYLRQLQNSYEQCHLLTLERKPVPDEEATQIKADLADSSIHWQPLTARPGNRVINTWREISGGYKASKRLVTDHNLNLIHARSFIPGNIGLRVAKKTGAKFLYDMRGFWAEEKIAKGTIKNPLLGTVAQRMEDRLFHQADALVSLTHVGKQRLFDRGIKTLIDVVPCCADTDVFTWDGRPRTEVRQMISVGSLGRGYLPSAVFGVFAAAQKKWPGVRLQLLTRTSNDIVNAAASKAGCDMSAIDIASATPAEVPGYLQRADIGLCMIEPSTAKIASSPTKLAEYFACGLPAIGNCAGIGDMKEILVENQVGSDVEMLNQTGYENAVDRFDELLKDHTLSRRCRDLAVNRFSVAKGVQTYGAVYDRLANGS